MGFFPGVIIWAEEPIELPDTILDYILPEFETADRLQVPKRLRHPQNRSYLTHYV